MADEVLVEHHILEYPGGYTRTVGPVIGRYLTGLRDGRLIAVRLADGRVLIPPAEYDPSTGDDAGQSDADFLEVGPAGVVTSWTWISEPRPKHPLQTPFAFALVKPDGADTAIVHVVDAGTENAMHTGMRVVPRWADARVGSTLDIEAWVPEATGGAPAAKPATSTEPVTTMSSPVRLDYDIGAGIASTRFLLGLAEGRILGQRTGPGGDVYVPPRGSDPKTGTPTVEEVEVGPGGVVTTFCVVNLPFSPLAPEVPYVCAQILMDGADIALFGLVADMPAAEVRQGLRVEAVWADELVPTLESIKWYRPTGEPDAEYDSYKEYL